jgi:signal transduction histidine kinase
LAFSEATNALLSTPILKTTEIRYAVALLATIVALLVRLALSPFLGDYVPFITLFPATAFCAWYCGVGPSILSMVLAIIGTKYWFIPPVHSLRIVGSAQVVSFLAFLLASGILVAMGEARRRREEVMSAAQEELEEAVRQRTVELDRTNQNLRELSARLMQLQDDERRRIARELHDSVGQMLAALGMNLATVGTDLERLTKTANTVRDSASLVQELSQEVRTISHLLHPPLLDEAGLASALRWYIEGFAQRSKIKVDLEVPAEFGRLTRESETAIFRTVQECLTNIHRHSESPTARIRIAASDGHVWVEVEDRGRGIALEKQVEMASTGTPGVGIRGMRERLRQLGGSLEIYSNGTGTLIVARLPLVFTSVSPAAA